MSSSSQLKRTYSVSMSKRQIMFTCFCLTSFILLNQVTFFKNEFHVWSRELQKKLVWTNQNPELADHNLALKLSGTLLNYLLSNTY